MTMFDYPDVPVDAEGRATHQHIAKHHLRGIPGGAEVTLCGVLIRYRTWKGFAPDAPWCDTCLRLDA